MNQRDVATLCMFAWLILVAGAMTLTHIGQTGRTRATSAAIAKKALAEKNVVGWVHLDPETAQLVYESKGGR